MDYIISLDNDAFLFINSFHNPFWDIFMKIATGRIIWGALYLSIIIALYRAYGLKAAIVMIAFCIIAVACADQVSASVLRPYFERLRPAHLENPISPYVHIVEGYRGGRYGFPSSHAANTFAAAMFLSLVFRRVRFTIAIFIWALLNCYSRIYLGVHYPGDLIFGGLIGIVIGMFCYYLASFLNNRLIFGRKTGQSDSLFRGYLGGLGFRYRVVDIVILVEVLTILGILIFDISLFL